MKLYFYKINTDERYGKVGIAVQVCEAEEKPKTYKSADRVFPNYLSIVRKDEEGQILHFDCLFLTEPNYIEEVISQCPSSDFEYVGGSCPKCGEYVTSSNDFEKCHYCGKLLKWKKWDGAFKLY